MSEQQNDGGPAFPQHGWTTNPEVLKRMKNQGGMSLRDYFIGQALAGICASIDHGDIDCHYTHNAGSHGDNMVPLASSVAMRAIDIANEALKARQK